MAVTAVILAGGRGSRMGGRDKGLVEYQGQRLIDSVLAKIVPQVDCLMINANRNHAIYQALGYPVISDANQQFDGPLAGMQAALQHAQTEWVLTLPCDCPYLPDDLCARLMLAINREEQRLAMAQSASGPHPVFCLMHRSLRQHLDEFLQSGQRQVRAWQTQHPHVWVHFEDDFAFTNFNTLPDSICPTP